MIDPKDEDALKGGKRQAFRQGTVSVGGWEWRSLEKKRKDVNQEFKADLEGSRLTF